MKKLNYSELKNCFYSPSQNRIIDLIDDRDRTVYADKTLAEVRADYPDVIKQDFDKSNELVERTLITDPTEIPEEEYDKMLDMLPPVGFTTWDFSQSFKMSERTSGRITRIYCKFGGKYYSFLDKITLSHVDVIAKVKSIINQKNGE